MSAPPAETLRAVANSRNSLPFSSLLRTNTGIANGRRGQLRRSISGFLRFKPSPLDLRYFFLSPHLVCQSSCWLRVLPPQNWSNSGRFSETTLVLRQNREGIFAFYSASMLMSPLIPLTSPVASIFPCVSVCLHFSLTEGKLCHTISP